MSSRWSTSRQTANSGISDDQIVGLVSKLQLFEMNSQRRSDKVVPEICNFIRRLHREVDDLERESMSELLSTRDHAQAAVIRSLLMHI